MVCVCVFVVCMMFSRVPASNRFCIDARSRFCLSVCRWVCGFNSYRMQEFIARFGEPPKAGGKGGKGGVGSKGGKGGK